MISPPSPDADGSPGTVLRHHLFLLIAQILLWILFAILMMQIVAVASLSVDSTTQLFWFDVTFIATLIVCIAAWFLRWIIYTTAELKPLFQAWYVARARELEQPSISTKALIALEMKTTAHKIYWFLTCEAMVYCYLQVVGFFVIVGGATYLSSNTP